MPSIRACHLWDRFSIQPKRAHIHGRASAMFLFFPDTYSTFYFARTFYLMEFCLMLAERNPWRRRAKLVDAKDLNS